MTSALASLWSHALSALSRLRATLLPLDTLLAAELRDLRTSLRAFEAFCRRLALTEAIYLDRALLDRGSSLSAQARRAKAEDPHRSAGAGVGNARLKTRGPRKPRLRLWPRASRRRPRVVLLGPPTSMREIWRDQERAALIARLAQARARRKPAHLRVADRIDALQRFLDAPLAGIRRLARRLRLIPKLAFRIAAKLTALRPPSSPYLADDRARESGDVCWAAVHDSS
jgi:hypothetical protein